MAIWNDFIVRNDHRTLQTLTSLQENAESLVASFLAKYKRTLITDKGLARAYQVHCLVLLKTNLLSLRSFLKCLRLFK